MTFTSKSCGPSHAHNLNQLNTRETRELECTNLKRPSLREGPNKIQTSELQALLAVNAAIEFHLKAPTDFRSWINRGPLLDTLGHDQSPKPLTRTIIQGTAFCLRCLRGLRCLRRLRCLRHLRGLRRLYILLCTGLRHRTWW